MSQFTLPDGSVVEHESSDVVATHAVDAQGEYLGLVGLAPGVLAVPGAPPRPGMAWDFVTQEWVRKVLLSDVVADALAKIDAAAGEARLRYITDVPGQQAVYVLKGQQAAAFLAAPAGAVPPYVAAEADAMGATPLQAAQLIAGHAAVWNDSVGPAIERERRRGKIRVEAAADPAAVVAELNTAIAILQGI